MKNEIFGNVSTSILFTVTKIGILQYEILESCALHTMKLLKETRVKDSD